MWVRVGWGGGRNRLGPRTTGTTPPEPTWVLKTGPERSHQNGSTLTTTGGKRPRRVERDGDRMAQPGRSRRRSEPHVTAAFLTVETSTLTSPA